MTTQLIQSMQQAIEALNEAVAFREGGRQKAIDAIDAITALRTAIQQATQPADVTDEPDLTSGIVNETCWKFVEAMPHQLPGTIWNDLKPALYAALIHYHRAMLALRPVQVPMTEWQPIEPAPKDGPFLAVLDCGGDQTICTMRHAVAASNNSRPDGDFIRERVTHWMPLPALPVSTYNGIKPKEQA